MARNGDVYVVGRTGSQSSPKGFVAVRRRRVWKVHRRRTIVRAVVAHKRGVLALDGRGVVQCTRRCRSGPSAPEVLTTFVDTHGGLRVVARSGALYSIRRRRLRRTLAKSSVNYPLTHPGGDWKARPVCSVRPGHRRFGISPLLRGKRCRAAYPGRLDGRALCRRPEAGPAPGLSER